MMKIILAKNNLNYIGLKNKLPWSCSDDLKHFKKLTDGKSLMVGRKTFQHMPVLPGRKVIVVGKGYNTLEQALEQNPDFVIGGKMLVESVMDKCDELILSIIDDDTIGDTHSPDFSEFKGKIHRRYFKTN